MSDLFVALPPVTSHGCVLFAKNADRPPSEVQEVVYHPPADHDPGTKVKCTFLEVDQAPHTHGVVASGAGWTWGCEMGANDQGVCGGCASVWTRLCHPGDHEEKLLGSDLVRLALERCGTAREAVDVVTSLLEKHGQGGACCEDPSFGQWTYHNAFLFADRHQAWTLDTAGTHWAAKKITEGFHLMSSALSIGTDYDVSSPGLREAALEICSGSHHHHHHHHHHKDHYGGSHSHSKLEPGPVDFAETFSAVFEGLSLSEKQQPSHRLHCGTALLKSKTAKGPLTVSDMMQVLRDTDSSLSMCGELLTMASHVSVIQPPHSKQPDVHWFTATPFPELSVFKPFIFCPRPDLGKATLSPPLSTEFRPRSGSQTTADRRHLLYRMHEQGREVMESGGSQGKRLVETTRDLERQCVKDVGEFLDNFVPALLDEVTELFKDITQSEISLYK